MSVRFIKDGSDPLSRWHHTPFVYKGLLFKDLTRWLAFNAVVKFAYPDLDDAQISAMVRKQRRNVFKWRPYQRILSRVLDVQHVEEVLGIAKSHPDVKENWDAFLEQHAAQIMYHGIKVRHGTCPTYLSELLESQSISQIVEQSRDPFWGTGLDNKGKNYFGALLSKFRRELVLNTPPPAAPPLEQGSNTPSS